MPFTTALEYLSAILFALHSPHAYRNLAGHFEGKAAPSFGARRAYNGAARSAHGLLAGRVRYAAAHASGHPE